MTQYAKFIDENNVRFCPKNLRETNFVAFNFDKASDEVLRSKGYYPLVYLEEPTTEEGFYSVPHYQLVDVPDTATYIAVTYTKEEIVDESADD